MELVEAVTRTGRRIHFAPADAPLTLCHHAVHERRIGGSWRPERVDVTSWQHCERCANKAQEVNR